MLDLLRRLWRRLITPHYDSTQEALKHYQPWSDPEHDVMGDVRAFIESERFRKPPPLGTVVERDMPPIVPTDKPPTEIAQPPSVSDRDLMGEVERKIWEDIEGGKPKHEPIAYPPPAEQTTQDWVTARLEELTGGLTRHPMDRTQYPTPPNEKDLAARAMFNGPSAFPMPRAMFTHGMSMRYLGELKARAEAKDRSLTAEQLMGLRARGLA